MNDAGGRFWRQISRAVAGDPEVRDDHAVESVLAAKEVLEQEGVEACAHLWHRLALVHEVLEDRVRRHDAGRLGRERARVRHEVLRELAARERREAPVVVVAVVAVGLRAVAGPVLGDRRGALRAEALRAALKPRDIRLDVALDRARVRTEGAVDPRPARLGREVGLRREPFRDADGAVLPAHDVGQATGQLGTSRGTEPDRVRHRRRPHARHGLPGGDGEAIARVAGDDRRDPERLLLGELLHAVVRGRQLVGRGSEPRDEGGHVPRGNQGLERGRRVALAGDRQRSVHEQASLLLQAHAPEQIGRALPGSTPPVLVRRQRAVAIEVAELQALDRDDRRAPRTQDRLVMLMMRLS